MDQTVHNQRHGEQEPGDLRALLAVLDGPVDDAPLDDGLHRLLCSIASLRRQAESRA